MKKLLETVLIGSILCFAVSGCGGAGAGTSPAGAAGDTVAGGAGGASAAGKETVTLTIESSQAFNVPSQPIFNRANIDAFEAQYPNIKIDILLIPDTQTTTTLQTKLMAGEPSDILIYNKVSGENELNVAANMIDLSNEPWVGRMKNKEPLYSPDGKIYGYHQGINTGGVGVVYNEEIFAELGLSIPTTYNEFLEVCETIQASGITPIYGPFKDVWTFQIFPTTGWGTIAQEVKPGIFDEINAHKLNWADVPEFVNVLERGNNIIQKGYVQETCLADDYNGAPAAFSSKQYAMMFIGDWFITDMTVKDPSLSLGLFPIPIFDDPALNLLDQGQIGPMLFIPKAAKNIEEAKLFIDFLSQPAQLENNMSDPALVFLPNFTDGPEPELSKINNYLYTNYVTTGKVSMEANAYVKVDLNDLWKYYQDMIGGSKTPAEVMSSWDLKFTELMQAKGFEGF